jgi:class 3 adenylate cyclase
MAVKGKILVVDDKKPIREPLMLLLEIEGHTVIEASNGLCALERLASEPVDLVLLDIMMPQIDGFETLTQIKANPKLKDIPVVMLSAVDDVDSVARCISLGAEDFLFKPFNKTLLNARVNSSLEKKQWHDLEKEYTLQIQQERQKSENLLLNILPKAISDRLKKDESVIADFFPEVTVLFADIVGFSTFANILPPHELITLLNSLFSRFDRLVDEYDLEKIKTIGDAYMIAGGLPVARPDHAEAVANIALSMLEELTDWNRTHPPLQMRLGISSGPAVAGVIGLKKFAYDVWGDVVNVADRMQSHGIPNEIQVSESAFQLLNGRFNLSSRGLMNVKGMGEIPTYLLKSKKTAVEIARVEPV